ncbi:hypothetical protein [Alkaliphilus sp. B6464]|uniref:hypothetical protein n=1 Tax=Alkaliphilus sp. B6464 TaxID=2731219 RepID=UPI001BA79DCE|nr:hypothetical protein [Alkaliphilus sp. B6464]QUH21735.1 hypothetical protein HYG84_17520 [Alkaliphilus sp. B6464]
MIYLAVTSPNGEQFWINYKLSTYVHDTESAEVFLSIHGLKTKYPESQYSNEFNVTSEEFEFWRKIYNNQRK